MKIAVIGAGSIDAVGGLRVAVQPASRLERRVREPTWRSATVSAVKLLPGVGGARTGAHASWRSDLELGAGPSKVPGRLFWAGHMGDLVELIHPPAIAGAGMPLLDSGADIEPGSGIAVTGSCWSAHPVPPGLRA